MLTWLRRDEIFQRFALAGISDADAKARLQRHIQDSGIVCDRPADPVSDLFKLDRIVPEVHARRWRPSIESIDWDAFSIDAPPSRGGWRPFGTPLAVIEVSRMLFPQLVERAAATGRPPTQIGAAIAELKKLWPPHGDPGATKPASVLISVNKNLPHPVGKDTLKRAIKAIRSAQKPFCATDLRRIETR